MRPRGGRTGATRADSAEVVEHLLDVVVLLELVDQLRAPPWPGPRAACTGVCGDVLRLGRDRRDAAVLERLLQVAEVGEGAADRRAAARPSRRRSRPSPRGRGRSGRARAPPASRPSGFRRKTPMRLNAKATLPVDAEVAAALVEVRRARWRRCGSGCRWRPRRAPRRRAGRSPRRGSPRSPPRPGPRPLDRRLDLVLGHVDGARVLDDAPQRRVVLGVRPARLHRDRDLLADAGERPWTSCPSGRTSWLCGSRRCVPWSFLAGEGRSARGSGPRGSGGFGRGV